MLKTVRNCWSIAAWFMCTIPYIKNRTNETSSS